MNMRRSAMAALLLLAGCGDPNEATREAIAKAEEKAADGGRIECATAGATSFARACTVERLKGPEGTMLIVHHADGGFRRLLVATDGRGVVAADGAEEAAVSVIAGDRIEVALGGDRYRLPATVKGPS
jgi:hypothetical protein